MPVDMLMNVEKCLDHFVNPMLPAQQMSVQGVNVHAIRLKMNVLMIMSAVQKTVTKGSAYAQKV